MSPLVLVEEEGGAVLGQDDGATPFPSPSSPWEAGDAAEG